MQCDCPVLQVESSSGWFSVIYGLCGYHLEMLFTFYKPREIFFFQTFIITEILVFIFEFKKVKSNRMVVERTFLMFGK